MSQLKLILVTMVMASGLSAGAATFQSCRADVAIDHFIDCERGLNSPGCRSERELLGSVLVNLNVEGKDIAHGEVTFQDSRNLGSSIHSDLDCALTDAHHDANDMECVSRLSLSPSVGRLTLSFNSYAAPYYVVLFAESSNVPNGAFLTDDCR